VRHSDDTSSRHDKQLLEGDAGWIQTPFPEIVTTATTEASLADVRHRGAGQPEHVTRRRKVHSPAPPPHSRPTRRNAVRIPPTPAHNVHPGPTPPRLPASSHRTHPRRASMILATSRAQDPVATLIATKVGSVVIFVGLEYRIFPRDRTRRRPRTATPGWVDGAQSGAELRTPVRRPSSAFIRQGTRRAGGRGGGIAVRPDGPGQGGPALKVNECRSTRDRRPPRERKRKKEIVGNRQIWNGRKSRSAGPWYLAESRTRTRTPSRARRRDLAGLPPSFIDRRHGRLCSGTRRAFPSACAGRSVPQTECTYHPCRAAYTGGDVAADAPSALSKDWDAPHRRVETENVPSP